MNTEVIIQSLQDGLMISIIGMGFVLIFLTLMMGFMRVTEVVMKKLNELFPEEVQQEVKKIVTSKKDEEVAVAIALAAKHNNMIKGGI